MSNDRLNNSILRSFDILSLFNASVPELGISDISVKIGINRSTVTRLVRTLHSLNYLEKSMGNSKYRLGRRIADLARAYYINLDLEQAAQPIMNELCEMTNETISLSILEGDYGYYLTWVDSPKPIRMVIEDKHIHYWLHAGAPGKLLLSFQSDSFIKDLVRRKGLPRFTDHTITDYDELMKELTQIRKEGLAVSHGEHIEYGSTVSAPVMNFSGKVVAALSVTWISLGDDPSQENSFKPLLKDAAMRLSEVLGYTRHHQAL